MSNFIIAPSILSSDFLNLGEVLRACQSAGADWIHVDVMDGQFVPNLTMGPFIVKHCRRATDLPLDVHLMVEKPETLPEAFAKVGASHLTVHVETCPHLHRTLHDIRGMQGRRHAQPGHPGCLDLSGVAFCGPGAGDERRPGLLRRHLHSGNGRQSG
jgi:ribulose-phosphate 3-epimerase